MKTLMQILRSHCTRVRTPSVEEQSLAQAVAAHDLQARQLTFEPPHA